VQYSGSVRCLCMHVCVCVRLFQGGSCCDNSAVLRTNLLSTCQHTAHSAEQHTAHMHGHDHGSRLASP
jgi:hypothetical protein